MEIKKGNKQTKAYAKVLSLLDDKSFMEIGEHISARLTSFYAPEEVQESDGVITGYGTIDGNLVYVFAQDGDVMGGTFGEMHGRKIVSVYEHAVRSGAPVIGLIDCSGFRVEEGLEGLDWFARLYGWQAYAADKVPQILCVTGPCGGGMSLATGMADFVFIEEENGSLFVSPKSMVAEDGVLDAAAGETSPYDDGVLAWDDIVSRVKELVGMLPPSADFLPLDAEPTDNLNRLCTGISGKLGDGRAMLTDMADDGLFIETKQGRGEDVITGFMRLGGQTVGACCCNNVDGKSLLSYQGVEKISSLVKICSKFDIPVVTVAYAEGYRQTAADEANLPAAVSGLVSTLLDADIPQINVIAGNLFGSAYSILSSKGMSADYVFIWDNAQASIINPEQAVEMINGTYTKEAVEEYKAATSGPLALARGGYVDKIIKPEETRQYVIGALETFVNR